MKYKVVTKHVLDIPIVVEAESAEQAREKVDGYLLLGTIPKETEREMGKAAYRCALESDSWEVYPEHNLEDPEVVDFTGFSK